MLYQTDLEDNLVGAVPDAAVLNTPPFIDYVENALGINASNYFNAGILLMNLQKMRDWGFEDKFVDLLGKYKFTVAQDQDYLNVLCSGLVKYIDVSWNVMPIPDNVCACDKPNLIHYNMLWKPWIFDNVLYEDVFWSYAKKNAFYKQIVASKAAATDEIRAASLAGGQKLLALAAKESKSITNYKNSLLK